MNDVNPIRASEFCRHHAAEFIGISLALTCFTGCSISGGEVATQPGFVLQGRVHGGQQPVSGAAIMLYAAGSAGNGSGAVNLLSPHIVTTDNTGSFAITGDYVCPSATTQVYLVARGGNPGLSAGTNNPALTMMAALGNCGGLTSSTYIFVNEITTAASAWALSQFLGPGAIVGSSATNATGLANGFTAAANIANITTGSAPGSTLPQGAVTETAKLYTLANALAACVNSDGTAACGPLFAAATVGSTAPSNTLDAALNIVRNPAANISAVFNLSTPAQPFQPALTAAPHDWTMSLTYGGCSTCGGLDLPEYLAIDATGNVWVANYYNSVVSRFSPGGVPATPTGFPGVGLRESFGIAIDATGNAWVTNQQSVPGANNSQIGSVSKFSPSGVELSGFGYTGGGLYYPEAAVADTNGDIWFADYGSSAATLLAGNGSAVSGGSGYGYSELSFTTSVALDASHNAWFGAEGAAVRVSPSGAVSSFSCCNEPTGIGVDQTGNIWIADYGAVSIVELTPTGAVANRISTLAPLLIPQSVAIDGTGNVWVANYHGDSITAVIGSTATLTSPPGGFGLDAPLDAPNSIAIDASGNLWLSNSQSNTVTQVVGIASPIATPLLGPPTKP